MKLKRCNGVIVANYSSGWSRYSWEPVDAVQKFNMHFTHSIVRTPCT